MNELLRNDLDGAQIERLAWLMGEFGEAFKPLVRFFATVTRAKTRPIPIIKATETISNGKWLMSMLPLRCFRAMVISIS